MRMTNKIMQNNSLYNINNNKLLQDKLSTQMSTQKKITRPSDDPVIAIRALRLRTSVSELVQYHEKNVQDAESWLNVTDKSLSTITDVLTDFNRKANTGANKEYNADNLKIILEQLKSLRDEFYSSGNMDYAGRYIFTGYRTDTPLSFNESVNKQPEGYPKYVITEQNTIEGFDTVNYTDIGGLSGLSKDNYTEGKYDPTVAGTGMTEQDILNGDIHRMRLSYDKLADVDLNMKVMMPDPADPNGPLVEDTSVQFAPDKVSYGADPNPYDQIYAANTANPPEEKVIFVPETGELLFSDASYSKLENALATNSVGELRFEYTKDQWENGDLRPEHYFACEATTKNEDGTDKTVTYNAEYLTTGKNKQTIEYDVGYNQKIQVNTTADEVFTHNLNRDIEDLERAISDLEKIEATKKDMEAVYKGMKEGDADYAKVKKQYEAAEKAYSHIRENVHKMYEKLIGRSQQYLDDTNIAVTDNGTRGQRLQLIDNRLTEQKTTFKTLQSENEDADIAEVAIQLTASELTYNAALMATGKIMQTSLMNYI